MEFARSDLPSDEQWAALTAQMANLWGGETAGLDQPDAPISHVSPASKAGAGGATKAAAGAGAALPGVAKVAGIAALAGALASGAWFASSSTAPKTPTLATAPSVVASPSHAAVSEQPKPPSIEPNSPEAPALAAEEVAHASSAISAPQKAAAPPSELRLLKHAREQLAKNPGQSLALCRQHQRLYPNGQLAQEREVLLIEALTRLNRDREAGQRRTQFGKAFPDSAHQSRVEQRTEP